MAHPRLPSDSCGRAEMCGHRLIQRRQVLVSFFFSAVNGCESNWSRTTNARQVGGAPLFCELVMYFREEGGWALVESLMVPLKKPLVQFLCENIQLRCFFLWFRRFSFASNTMSFSVNRDLTAIANFSTWASSFPRAWNHAHTSKSLRTRYNTEEYCSSNRAEARKLRRTRCPEASVTDVDLQKITVVFK